MVHHPPLVVWFPTDRDDRRLPFVREDIYGVTDPRLRYSVTTLGPATRYRLTGRMDLNVDFGFSGFHRFEFYDGDDEQNSFNLKSSVFFRAGFVFGG